VQWAVGVVVILLFPIRLTVLAPGELVPANPAVIRAPLEGVVGSFSVKPNQIVKVGQPLFNFDDASLKSKLEVAQQALSGAQAEYRQSAQLAVTEVKYKGQLALLMGKVEERQAEADYLQGQLERAHILAPQAGIALFDDPSEWIGKPVATGERIMRIAAPDDVEVEAWLAVGDAVPLPVGAPVSLYLNASPLFSVAAQLRYVAHDAVQRPDGSYAYRVRASLDHPTEHRVGLKGTAKLTGSWVPLLYWVLRRPVAGIRQMIGW
jgi:multidrug efflux pump subunit AcrA (membrane-fusion protein)